MERSTMRRPQEQARMKWSAHPLETKHQHSQFVSNSAYNPAHQFVQS